MASSKDLVYRANGSIFRIGTFLMRTIRQCLRGWPVWLFRPWL